MKGRSNKFGSTKDSMYVGDLLPGMKSGLPEIVKYIMEAGKQHKEEQKNLNESTKKST